MEPHIYGVTEVNQLVKGLLDSAPALQGVAVRGELSNYKIYPSGHHYFTLKDQEGALRCVMFRGQASRLRFRPENGMKAVASGRITVFPRDGAYQLYCDSLIPEGVGDLAVAFQQLKEKLWKEGLFDPAHKKPLPPYPEKIAIVTSGAGAAVHDMIRILRRRYPIARVILLPVRVQGAEAPPEIVGAIRYADRWKIGDVIITGRGGGSMEDLWAFNDERVARAIYDCETPIISAVGHEPDVTIADFVADARASTPSNAAEIAVPDRWSCAVAPGRRGADGEKRDGAAGGRPAAAHRPGGQAGDDGRNGLRPGQAAGPGPLTAAAGGRDRRGAGAAPAEIRGPGGVAGRHEPLAVLGRGYAVARDEQGKILKSWRETAPGSRVSVTLGEGGFTAVVDKPYTKEEQP